MAAGQDSQLEKVIEEASRSGNAEALDLFLRKSIHEGTPITCSQHFLTHLDTFIGRSLHQKDTKSASLGLAVLNMCGKNLRAPGDDEGLSGIIAQGLIKKWFEKCRQMWIQRGPCWSETMFSLSEDFFDALMVVHKACQEGTCEITESFLYPLGHLAIDTRIYILIRKEAIRKCNLILDKIPVELKKVKKILTSQEASDIMIKLAGHILEGGDYDLQTALIEALCRMANPGLRKELADLWFSMEHVARAFVKISDSEFETDCRKFLNMVNGMQGDKRRVYSYPCLEVYLDKYELLMPADEKLEEFWIDFNLGSRSISFYFSLADEEAQEGQWETICISENEVQSYTVSEKGKTQVLQLKLSEVVIVGTVEGSSLTIYFSSSLGILRAAHSVYGHRKDKDFAGKTGTSVAKTAVRIVMEEKSSQVAVPESPVALGGSEKNAAPQIFRTPSTQMQIKTPAKIRMSESTTFIRSSGGRSGVSSMNFYSAVLPSKTPAKDKGNHSCDRQSDVYLGDLRIPDKNCNLDTTPGSIKAGGTVEESTASKQPISSKADKLKKNIQVAEAVDIVLAGQGNELSQEDNFVPDTQPRAERNVSNQNKTSVSEMQMMPTQKISYLPKPELTSSLGKRQEDPSSAQRFLIPGSGPVSQRQFHIRLTQHLQDILNERNQDPSLQGAGAAQGKRTHIRQASKGRSCGDRCDSTVCPPKEQQIQKSGPPQGKKRGRLPLKPGDASVEAPTKASTSKSLQERITPNVKIKPNLACSSKAKRDAEVAGSTGKPISRHYEISCRKAKNINLCRIPPIENRTIFNMSCLTNAKKENPGAVGSMRPAGKTEMISGKQRKDVFTFSTDPPLTIGGKVISLANSSAISSSSGLHDSSIRLTTNKTRQPAEKRNVRKHLFSDTDDFMTEASWLRESSKEPKPQIAKYSRKPTIKPKTVSPCASCRPLEHRTDESPNFFPLSPKPVKSKIRVTKKMPSVKKALDPPKKAGKPTAAPSRPRVASRRSQRVAATTAKRYREPDTDESQSESEKPPAAKLLSTDQLTKTAKAHETAQIRKKKNVDKQMAKSIRKPESSHHNGQSVSEEAPISKQKNVVGQRSKSEKTFSEGSVVNNRKMTSDKPSSGVCRRLDSSNQSDFKTSYLKQQKPQDVLQEAIKSSNVRAQERKNTRTDARPARRPSLSPLFIERMRSAERSAPTLGLTCSPLLNPRESPLPASPDPPCQGKLSPILLLPKPDFTVSRREDIGPSSFYSTEKRKKHNTSRAQSSQCVPFVSSPTSMGQTPASSPPMGPCAVETNSVQRRLFSAPRPTLSIQPLLTSTLLEQDKSPVPSPSQSPFPEASIHQDCHFGYSRISSVSDISLGQSSTKSSVSSRRVMENPGAALAFAHKKENTPPSDPDPKPAHLHVSGPSRKHISSPSNSEEDTRKNKSTGQRSPRMKPRRLFQTFAEVSVGDEMSQVMSSSDTASPSHGEAERSDDDMDIDDELELPDNALNPGSLCQQLSSELKKKFQNRLKTMEFYNKQSLKTVQQHVSSLNMQVAVYRTQKLKQVQNVLLEEISKLEQEDTVLRSMERDQSIHWKKQAVSFHSYREQETRRNVTLHKALQSDMCHSLEYEERIFSSQMCQIKKDLRSAQDRLLSKMQEGEIQSVKRGLHALFFPNTARI